LVQIGGKNWALYVKNHTGSFFIPGGIKLPYKLPLRMKLYQVVRIAEEVITLSDLITRLRYTYIAYPVR